MKKLLLAIAASTALAGFGTFTAKAETTECTEITVLPATINTQGIYCLKKNLTTAINVGAAITINTNNVTIDLNGWKLGGSVAGTGTLSDGIFADNRKNIILRNGTIRGFHRGIFLGGSSGNSSGHIVENILADGNRFAGLWVEGDGTAIRNNNVTNTGPGSHQTTAYGIFARAGSGISISGNTVSGVNETNLVYGIVLDQTMNVEIHKNRVFNLISDAFKHGIASYQSARVAVIDNTVSTGTGGINGIWDIGSSTNLACIDNQVSGFVTNYLGCDLESGNVNF